jgi:hypothetical protein
MAKKKAANTTLTRVSLKQKFADYKALVSSNVFKITHPSTTDAFGIPGVEKATGKALRVEANELIAIARTAAKLGQRVELQARGAGADSILAVVFVAEPSQALITSLY